MDNPNSETFQNSQTNSRSDPPASPALSDNEENNRIVENVEPSPSPLSNSKFKSSFDNLVNELNEISLNTDEKFMGNADLLNSNDESSNSSDDFEQEYLRKPANVRKKQTETIDESLYKVNVQSGEGDKFFYPPTVVLNENKAVYITPDALKYTPAPDQIVKTMKDGEKFRLIFCNQDFTDEEKRYINNYKKYAISKLKGISLDDPNILNEYSEYYKDCIFSQDHFILRYLQGNNFDPVKTLVDVTQHLEWRQQSFPIYQKDLEPFLEMGFCYIYGRDKCSRPIVIIRLSKSSNLKRECLLRVLFYWLELILNKMLIPGKIEQWRILVDLHSYNIFNLPLAFLKEASKILTTNYRSRLAGMIILNSPLVISGIWNVIKGMLPVHTQQKIILTSHSTSKQFLSSVDPSQVEKRYGGTGKNNIAFKDPVFPPL